MVCQLMIVVDHGSKIVVVKIIIVDLVVSCTSPRPQVIVYVNQETNPEPSQIELDEWDVREPKLATDENKAIYLSDFRKDEAMILITSDVWFSC